MAGRAGSDKSDHFSWLKCWILHNSLFFGAERHFYLVYFDRLRRYSSKCDREYRRGRSKKNRAQKPLRISAPSYKAVLFFCVFVPLYILGQARVSLTNSPVSLIISCPAPPASRHIFSLLFLRNYQRFSRAADTNSTIWAKTQLDKERIVMPSFV